MNKSCCKLVKQQGASLVLTVMILAGILGFFALAIDVGYLFVVRNQLQNAADTAALSGANYLYPLVNTSPNWGLASSKATSAVQQNKADNLALVVGTINTGYWNITGIPTGLHASKLDANNDYPAIEVNIAKTSSNGVVNAFFAGVLGINSFSPSATAVAVGGLSPGYTKENISPFVIPGCVFGVSVNGLGNLIYPDGVFQLERSYGPTKPACNTGQWTALQTTKDLTGNVIKGLINALSSGGTSSSNLSIGDMIFLQSGTSLNFYSLVNSCSIAGNAACGYVIATITCPVTGLCNGVLIDAVEQVVGFVCVEIISANDFSKYMTYQVVPQSDPNYKLNCNMHDSGGIGPSGGATMPPKLVNYWGNVY